METDQRLRAVVIDDETDELLPDSILREYRSGGLSASEARSVEEVLGRSFPARKRFAELAASKLGGSKLTMSPGEFLAERTRVSRGSSRGRPWLRVAAGLLFGASLLGGGYFLFEDAAPRSDRVALAPDSFRAFVRGGIAKERGASDSQEIRFDTEIAVLPSTFVEITFDPQVPAPGELDYALYRQEVRTLERIPLSPSLSLDMRYGLAVLSGLAEALVGSTEVDPAGNRATIYLVVAAPGSLPATVSISDRAVTDTLSEVGQVVGSLILDLGVSEGNRGRKSSIDESAKGERTQENASKEKASVGGHHRGVPS